MTWLELLAPVLRPGTVTGWSIGGVWYNLGNG